jgi:tol-pal system protein YbgF
LACALAAGAIAAGAVAAAQTIVNAPPSDPLVESLRDQVNALEAQVRNLTGENERLQFQLRQAKEENAQAQRVINDMQQQANPQPAMAAAPSPPAAGGVLGTLPQADVAAAGAAVPGGGDPVTAFSQAYTLITRGDYVAAQNAFAAFLAAYPSDSRAPSARYWLGQAMLQQGANSDAASQSLTIVKKSPKADIAPDALVRLGVALNRMGEKAQACATLASLAATFPKATPATKASATAQSKAIGC